MGSAEREKFDMQSKAKIFFLIFFVTQTVLWITFSQRVIYNTYPVCSDQVNFINAVYRIQYDICEVKDYQDIVEYIVESPQGFLYVFLGVIVTFFIGINRYALVAVNIVFFLLKNI